MGAMRRAMAYIGLAEEERYEDYEDEAYEEEPEHRELPHARHERSAVTPLPQRARVTGVVGGARPLNRIVTIHPREYNDAKEIGETFRGGIPVIMNLTELDDPVAKRLVDFAVGLVFGLEGELERVTSRVFLLSPSHVEVDAGESDAPHGTSEFFNEN